MESFDYVVIGAGSAGCVLANRLTADGTTRVLLLEAGGSDDVVEVHAPGAWSALLDTERDWAYTSVPQKATGRSVHVPRGRMLGGSSSINAMIYMRGNHVDYDRWRDEFGATGWGFDDVLPYFLKAESNARLGGPWHGVDGPLRVEDQLFTHHLSRDWVGAAIDWGLPDNDDFNGASQIGAGLYQLTCRDGQRWSVADAYLHPVADRANLTVRTDATVSRILIQNGAATGVVYRRAGVEETVRAEGEVLLCAGAIASPQLLMLSGIGPAEHLREHDVETLLDVPAVGEGLQDHASVPLVWHTQGTTDERDLAGSEEALAQWLSERRGPLTTNIAASGMFFSTNGSPVPDIQVHAGASTFWDDGRGHSDRPGAGGTVTLLTPESRGRVSLRSAEPTDQPEIDFRFYEHRADLDTLVTGLEMLFDIAARKPLAPYLTEPLLLGTSTPDRARLAEHALRYTQTLYHPVGTCAMGAVVDPRLRVRGVDRLRVVDASVMPAVVRGNTNAPTVMIAEKAADLLR